MNRCHATSLAGLFGSLLALSACGSDFDRAAQNLDQRMNTELAPDIAAHRVAVEPQPDGERVTLIDPSLFSGGGTKLNGQGQDTVISFIHALLEPRIYTLQVSETQDPARTPEGARAAAVEQYFTSVGFASQLRPHAPTPEAPANEAGTVPPGVALTVRLLPVEICRLNQGPQADCP